MTCPKCNLPSTITTHDFFSNICSNCGTLISETNFLSENILQSSSQILNTISISSKLSRRLENFTHNSTLDKTINSLISKLSLPSHFVPKVKRYYNCCINKNFAKGRTTLLIVSTILYVLCRIEKIQYLLMDFSEITKINLYKLATCYIQFIKIFNIKLNIVDPSLFIRRFCLKLELNDKNIENSVCKYALKVIQCMKKDWICEGRNPSGLCGAAIAISLVLCGYKCDLDVISRIVLINKETIQQRINEFKNTMYVNMSKEDFDRVDITSIKDEKNPPCFVQDNNKNASKLDIILRDKECNVNDENDSYLKSPKHFDSFTVSTVNSPGIKPIDYYDNNELSDLDDNECEEYIENKERYCVKKELWKEKNKEWLNEQEDKKKVNEKDFIEKKRYIKLNEIGYRTPKEAIMHNERFLKMRMKNKGTFIKELFDDPGLVSEINVYKHKTNLI